MTKAPLIFATIFLAFISQSVIAQTSSCDSILSAYALWEDEIDGQIVERVSTFPIPDWSPGSRFDGVILNRDFVRPLLELEVSAEGFYVVVSTENAVESDKVAGSFEFPDKGLSPSVRPPQMQLAGLAVGGLFL